MASSERVRRAGTESVALAVGLPRLLPGYWNNSLNSRAVTEFSAADSGETSRRGRLLLEWRSREAVAQHAKRGLSRFERRDPVDLARSGWSCYLNRIGLLFGCLEPSPVLLAMGLTPTEARSCLRLSWGWQTTQADIDVLLERLPHHVQRLREKQLKKNTRISQISMIAIL